MTQVDFFGPIEWDESMATGIDTIDKQHQYLVDTLREANRKLLADEGHILLSRFVKDLLGYAIMHFETEEALMQRYGYAEACAEEARDHIAQHREFSRQVVALHNQLREGRRISRMDILEFLNQWLQNHVLGIDQLLAKFLSQKMGKQV